MNMGEIQHARAYRAQSSGAEGGRRRARVRLRASCAAISKAQYPSTHATDAQAAANTFDI